MLIDVQAFWRLNGESLLLTLDHGYVSKTMFRNLTVSLFCNVQDK